MLEPGFRRTPLEMGRSPWRGLPSRALGGGPGCFLRCLAALGPQRPPRPPRPLPLPQELPLLSQPCPLASSPRAQPYSSQRSALFLPALSFILHRGEQRRMYVSRAGPSRALPGLRSRAGAVATDVRSVVMSCRVHAFCRVHEFCPPTNPRGFPLRNLLLTGGCACFLSCLA